MTIDEKLKSAVKTLNIAYELLLSGAAWLIALGPRKVAEAANGIGPARWPEKWRKKLDKWLWLFRPAADIHDCRFTYDNDGSDAKFRAANDEIERNCLLLADARYSWYNPLRYLWRHRAHAVAFACRAFGWEAWIDAYKTNQKEAK